MVRTLPELRSFAVARACFPPRSLTAAFDVLGFVQADPIRAPAPAQDLILRHRVRGYRVGDLDRSYAAAGLEEGLFYAYGYLPRANWDLLRTVRSSGLTRVERAALDFVQDRGTCDASALEEHIGRGRALNAWGRLSRKATLVLERLQARGLLRIAGRLQGRRCYALAPPPADTSVSAHERCRRLILLVARVLAPISDTALRRVSARFRRVVPRRPDHVRVLHDLYRTGQLVRQPVDGVDYVWPSEEHVAAAAGADERVRFLAPFDPLVWDRARFEHLWGWTYRFEAYTPPAKRVRGYYALPLLFGERVIGWANAAIGSGTLTVDVGFAGGRRPAARTFQRALDREIAELEACLTVARSHQRALEQP